MGEAQWTEGRWKHKKREGGSVLCVSAEQSVARPLNEDNEKVKVTRTFQHCELPSSVVIFSNIFIQEMPVQQKYRIFSAVFKRVHCLVSTSHNAVPNSHSSDSSLICFARCLMNSQEYVLRNHFFILLRMLIGSCFDRFQFTTEADCKLWNLTQNLQNFVELSFAVHNINYLELAAILNIIFQSSYACIFFCSAVLPKTMKEEIIN